MKNAWTFLLLGWLALEAASGQPGPAPSVILGRVGRPLVGVILHGSAATVDTTGRPGFGGLSVESLPELRGKKERDAIADRLEPYLNRPITLEMARKLRADLMPFLRRRLGQEVQCIFPNQETGGGVLQLLVTFPRRDPVLAVPGAGTGKVLTTVRLLGKVDELSDKFPEASGLDATRATEISAAWLQRLGEIEKAHRGKPATETTRLELQRDLQEYLTWASRERETPGLVVEYFGDSAPIADGVATFVVARPKDRPGGNVEITSRFGGIRLVGTKDSVTNYLGGVPPQEATVEVEGVPFLGARQKNGIAEILVPHLGKPMPEKTLVELHAKLISFVHRDVGILVDLYSPDVAPSTNGVLLMVLEPVKVRKVTVVNREPVMFSDKTILRMMRLKEDTEFRFRDLDRDLDWLNRNGNFRGVAIQMVKPPDAADSFAGPRTDLEVVVDDNKSPLPWPVRPYVGYDNTGNELVGEHRLNAGLNYGNLFGLDHQVNYQFTSDVEFNSFQAHMASYVAPLPWFHTFTVFGYYADISPDLSAIGFDGFGEEDKNYQASARYSVPLPAARALRLKHEAYAGFDFKHIETSLQFGVTSISELLNQAYGVGQFVVGYDASLSDKLGQTTFSAAGYYSPGGIAQDSSQSDYERFRPGASPDYFYGVLGIKRETTLPAGLIWRLRASGQLASDKLMPSEQFGVGGWNSIRGYAERVLNGDEGFFVSNEILSPTWEFGWPGWRNRERARLQFLAFFDYGLASVPTTAGGTESVDLYSIGAGLRFTAARNVDVRLDYGYGLASIPASVNATDTSRSHVHAGVVVGF